MTNKKMKAHMRNLYKIFIVFLCLMLVATVIPSDVFALRSMAHVNFAGQAAQGENRHGTTGLSSDLSPGHKLEEGADESIIKFFLEGNEGAALEELQAKNNGGIEFVSYVRNSLLPAIRRKVDSLSPNELLNIDNILSKLVAQIEDQTIKNKNSPILIKIINNFLVINIRPFMDKNYKTRVANLLPAHENPALLDMFDRLRVSDNFTSFSGVGARLHASDIIIEADDGRKFKFDIQSFDIDIPEERHYQKEAKPWKAVCIKYRYNKKEMAFLDLRIYYEVNEQGKSVLARGVMDYAFSGKDIVAMEVSPDISDDYSGVGTTMMALAIAIAAKAGATNLLVSDVLDDAVAFYEKLYPGEIDPDKKFKFLWRQREGEEYRSRYALDLNKVVALPGTGGIKKRKSVSINEAAAEYVRARAITLSRKKAHDDELSRQYKLEDPGPMPKAINVFIQANREGARAGRQLIRTIVNSGITDADSIRQRLKSLVEDLDEDEMGFFNREIERILRVNMGSRPVPSEPDLKWPNRIPEIESDALESILITHLPILHKLLAHISVERNLGVTENLSQAQQAELLDILKQLAGESSDEFKDAHQKAIRQLGSPQDNWAQKKWMNFARLILFYLNQSLFVPRGWLIDIGIKPGLGGPFLRPLRGRVEKFAFVEDEGETVILAEVKEVSKDLVQGDQLIGDARALFIPAFFRSPGYILFSYTLFSSEDDDFFNERYDATIRFANKEQTKRDFPAAAQILNRLSSVSKSEYRQIHRRLALQEEWSHYKEFKRRERLKKSQEGKATVDQYIKLMIFPEDTKNPLQKAIRDHLLGQAEQWGLDKAAAHVLMLRAYETREMLNNLFSASSAEEFLVSLIEIIIHTRGTDNEDIYPSLLSLYMYASRLILYTIEEMLQGRIAPPDSEKVKAQEDLPQIAQIHHEQLWEILKANIGSGPAETPLEPRSGELIKEKHDLENEIQSAA